MKSSPKQKSRFIEEIIKKNRPIFLALLKIWFEAGRPEVLFFALSKMRELTGKSLSYDDVAESLVKIQGKAILVDNPDPQARFKQVPVSVLSGFLATSEMIFQVTFSPFVLTYFQGYGDKETQLKLVKLLFS